MHFATTLAQSELVVPYNLVPALGVEVPIPTAQRASGSTCEATGRRGVLNAGRKLPPYLRQSGEIRSAIELLGLPL